MEKIKDLILIAARGAGLPEKLDINDDGLWFEFLVSARILIPVIVMQTNICHFRAFGKPLIPIKGHIIPDADLPFGCRLEGDIDLEVAEYALGYMLICATATCSELKAYILSGQLDEIALLWKKEVEKMGSGKTCLNIDDYIHLPPFKAFIS